jgi:hypothetical protein
MAKGRLISGKDDHELQLSRMLRHRLVCERHPYRAFDYELGCACSEGKPCKCNDSDPPDTSEVIVVEEATRH